MKTNDIADVILDSAFLLHRELGPGLLERVYETVLARDVQERGLRVECQLPIPINIREIQFDEGFRADRVVERKVLLELKSVEKSCAYIRSRC